MDAHEMKTPAGEAKLSDIELRFYYFGFHTALVRYRRMTMIGWLVTAIGCASFPLAWSAGRSFGIVDIMLAASTLTAGLALVSQSVSSIQHYIGIAIPSPQNGQSHPLIHDVIALMQDVDIGGWQEASTAMRTMEGFHAKYGVPALP
jgi:hypothetical protein